MSVYRKGYKYNIFAFRVINKNERVKGCVIYEVRYKDSKVLYQTYRVMSFFGRLFQKEVCAYVGGV